MILHIPTYLDFNSPEVEVDTELSDNEQVIGWIDEYGTIMSSKANVHIGDVVDVSDGDYEPWRVLIVDMDELRKLVNAEN